MEKIIGNKKKKKDLLLHDKSRLRPPNTNNTTCEGGRSSVFQCGECYSTNDDDDGVRDSNDDNKETGITFYCQLDSVRLVFDCREPSYGVLMDKEPAVVKHTQHKNNDDYNVLLDGGFSIMGRTGFQVWPGSRIMMEALLMPSSSDCASLQHWQQRLFSSNNDNNKPIKILELGAGVGCVGTMLAAAAVAGSGVQVLLTDLPRIVSESILPNLERNCRCLHNNHQDDESPPLWLEGGGGTASTTTAAVPQRIGAGGWIGTTSLDWTLPLESQLRPEQYQDLDLIVACDCVWLISLLESLLATVDSIFRLSKSPLPTLLLSFQQRDSDMFTTVDRVLEELEQRQWNVECLAWYPVVYESSEESDDNDHSGTTTTTTTTKELYLLQITCQ